jgi:hypothetical protein
VPPVEAGLLQRVVPTDVGVADFGIVDLVKTGVALVAAGDGMGLGDLPALGGESQMFL